MTKIYTKTGDQGQTGTFYGRMSKDAQLAKALGSIDELNSAIGVCRHTTPLDEELKQIQKNLLTIGSSLSGSEIKISSTETRNLEKLIDKITKELPKLSNFIYPKGNLQLARAVARRAEREVVQLSILNSQLSIKDILKYLNRLSDALFTLGRWVNYKIGIEEEVWKA